MPVFEFSVDLILVGRRVGFSVDLILIVNTGKQIVLWLNNNVGAKSGNAIRTGMTPVKTHEIKHAIAHLLNAGIIQIDTADTSTDYRQWDLDTYTVV